MGSRSKRFKRRVNPNVAKRRNVWNARSRTRGLVHTYPKKYRGFNITEHLLMLPFYVCEELLNRVRYRLWRTTGGRVRP